MVVLHSYYMSKWSEWRKKVKLSQAKKKTASIEATEGHAEQVDPLNPPPCNRSTSSDIRKNNFTNYSTQVYQILENYNACSEYGPTMTKVVIDVRTAFICGGGMTVKVTSGKAGQKWVDNFIDINKLTGSTLIDMVELIEKEGKNLVILRREGTDKDSPIRIYLHPWTEINYDVETDKYRQPERVTLQDGKKTDGGAVTKEATTYEENEFVYINTGGSLNNINTSPPRIASVLTQVENYERALYDLRANNHLFGNTKPIIKTKDKSDANFVQTYINESNWNIGKYLVGPLEAKYLEPGGGALAALLGEMGLNAKVISAVTGLPVHWIGWTDLLANRATAETLDELIKFATKKERIKLIEGMESIIQKARLKAIAGGQDVPELDIEIDLPNITSADLKAIQEIFHPLQLDGVISMLNLRGRIPGIEPAKEDKQIKKEQALGEPKKPVVKTLKQELVERDQIPTIEEGEEGE